VALSVALDAAANQNHEKRNMDSTADPPTGSSGQPAESSPPSSSTKNPRQQREAGPSLAAQQNALPCPTCVAPLEAQGRDYVYALGRIEPRFPSLGLEKEYAQAVGRSDTAGLTDRQTMQSVLGKREYRYLTRQLCWVMSILGLETYLLQPRDPLDFELLVQAANGPDPVPWLSVVIGLRGPIAPPEMCNGLLVPVVGFDQIYSFDRESLIKSIPKPGGAKPKEFAAAAGELFERIMQITDNVGATNEHRALNYLAVRYPEIYSTAAEQYARDASLSAVEVRPSPLSSTREVVDVIFAFTNRNTDVTEKLFVRVDVTEEFPFLITKMSPYFDRY
jgi:hypothetical protein